MPEQRETTTDKLASVIDVLQLGDKTGILSVERGEGASFEEGAIRLISGQITEASVGQRKGQEALNLLRLWGACRFTFIPTVASMNTNTRQPGARVPSAAQGLMVKVPLRTRSHEEALRLMDGYGLSRSHRQLCLLIDGTRNTVELMRLTGRSQEEISRLLQDLEHVGVIRL